jgi:hypothetical protein
MTLIGYGVSLHLYHSAALTHELAGTFSTETKLQNMEQNYTFLVLSLSAVKIMVQEE